MIWRNKRIYEFVYQVRITDGTIENRYTKGILIDSYHDLKTFVIITEDNPDRPGKPELAIVTVDEYQVVKLVGEGERVETPWIMNWT